MSNRELQQELKDLYKRYAGIIHYRCYRILSSEDEAWDATQDVFVKLNHALQQIRKRESVYSWLLSVSTHHCISILRKSRGVGLDEQVHQPTEQKLDQEKQTALREIVSKLMAPWDRKTREAAVYAYVDGYKRDEIARIMGLGESTVRKYLTRFKKRSQEIARRYHDEQV